MVNKQKILITLLFSAVLLSGSSFFGFKAAKTEAESNARELSMNTEAISTIQGNSLMPLSDPAGPELKVARKMQIIATAYSSTVEETDETPFITANNTQVRDGIIANNILPFGTKVRIPELYGDKVFVVEDRMSWKKGNYQIDIWFASHTAAEQFGAKRTYIEVLES